MTRVRFVPVLSDPLKKLEIILHFALDQGFDGDGLREALVCALRHHYANREKTNLVNLVRGEVGLKDFEVCDIFVVKLRIELDLCEWNVACRNGGIVKSGGEDHFK